MQLAKIACSPKSPAQFRKTLGITHESLYKEVADRLDKGGELMRIVGRILLLMPIALTGMLAILALNAMRVDQDASRAQHGAPELVVPHSHEQTALSNNTDQSSLDDSEDWNGEDEPTGEADTAVLDHPSSSVFSWWQRVTHHPAAHSPLFIELKHLRC